MKKASLFLCLLFAATFILPAQEYSSGKSGGQATFAKNSFWSNWFIGAGAGASIYIGPYDQHADLFKRFTVNPTIMIGKWFAPTWGVRLAGQGGKIHTFHGESGGSMQMFSQTHINAHADFLWNVTNTFLPYNKDRFYNFIPNVGFGYARRTNSFDEFFDVRGFNGMTVNAGLLNTFRFSDRLSLFIEISGELVERRFDISPWGDYSLWQPILNGNAGLIFNLGKVGFTEAHLMDEGLINDLNNQINRLRNEQDELRKRPASCPPEKVCPPVQQHTIVNEGTYVPNVVFFRLNSAVIDSNQEISIYNTAEYLKANPDAKVKIVGYADKQTGTAEYNMQLSEKRAKNVAKNLVDKYNINSNRVQVEWKGSSEQPYKENAWNRVAIFFAE